jgi:hypothetical protein
MITALTRANGAMTVADERTALMVGMEAALIEGDLRKLTPEQRVMYYQRVCDSVGLNPLTKPFAYLELNGKLILYARRDCTDQLRTIKGISISEPVIRYEDDLVIVTVTGVDRTGRQDTELGACPLPRSGEARANAVMKAITKAKRRLTLSLAGLGWTDETETDTIQGARLLPVNDAGDVIDEPRHAETSQDDPTLLAWFDQLEQATTYEEVWGVVDARKALVEAGEWQVGSRDDQRLANALRDTWPVVAEAEGKSDRRAIAGLIKAYQEVAALCETDLDAARDGTIKLDTRWLDYESIGRITKDGEGRKAVQAARDAAQAAWDAAEAQAKANEAGEAQDAEDDFSDEATPAELEG